MDLKEFIKQTISGIVEATSELQNEFEAVGVIINPPVSPTGEGLFREDSYRHTFRRIQSVDFDVAVTAASETSGGGKAGLKVFSVEAGVDGKHGRRSEEVSRVSFSVPLVLSASQAEVVNRFRQSEARERQNMAMGLDDDSGGWKSV